MSDPDHGRPKPTPGRAARHEVLVAEEAVHRLSTAEPLDVDGSRTVGTGVALWALAGVVLLVVYRDELDADGNQWWLWTCLAGVGLGLLGWAYCRRRRDQARALRATGTATGTGTGTSTGPGRRGES